VLAHLGVMFVSMVGVLLRHALGHILHVPT
jgi:hypothetical protein